MAAAFIWMMYNIIKGYRLARKACAEIPSPVHVTCNTCKTDFDTTWEALLKHYISGERYKKVRTGFMTTKKTTKLTKYVYCPHCQKETAVDVHDLDEIMSLQNETVKPILIKYLALGFVPAIIIGSII